jgi:acyl carrier protein
MGNLEKYNSIFLEVFEVDASKLETLNYQDVSLWDSVGHMNLITRLEEDFGILIDTDDIIELSSYNKGISLLKKYSIEI